MASRKEELDAEKQRAIQHWQPKNKKGGKATYDRSNVFGGTEHKEGRAVPKEPKKGRGR